MSLLYETFKRYTKFLTLQNLLISCLLYDKILWSISLCLNYLIFWGGYFISKNYLFLKERTLCLDEFAIFFFYEKILLHTTHTDFPSSL